MILNLFLDPSAFWWLLLLPVIVFFYFLKLKRDECLIPSTLLWKKVIEDTRVNSLFARLKKNLLLFFQLLLMALLILALARPFLASRTKEEKKIVLLIDRSASMGTKEAEDISRMDKAKSLAEKIVDDLMDGDSAMIISFAKHATVHQSFTGLKSLLKERIRSLSPLQEETRIEEALLIAQSMLEKVPSSTLYIITDGIIPDWDKIKEQYLLEKNKKKTKIVLPKFLLLGEKSANVAILGFEIRSDKLGKQQGFAKIQNLGDKPAKGYIELYIHGEALLQEIKTVDLGPGDTIGVFFPNLPVQEGRVEASFVLTQGEDYLALDNKAYFFVQAKQKHSIALVTKGNFFLQRVLVSYESDLSILSSEEYQKEEKKFDVVVFDDCSPDKKLPSGGYLFIHSMPLLPGLQVQGEIQSNSGSLLNITDQNEFHPSMRFVDMRKLSLKKAMNLLWPLDTVPILESQNHILIGSFTRGKQDYIIIAFDLLHSDWPLKLSFPLFMANTIEWLLEKQTKNNIRTGESFEISMPKTIAEIQIIDPIGKKFFLPASPLDSPIFSQAHYAGFYDIQATGVPRQTLAANFFSQQESTVSPRKDLFPGEKTSQQNLEPVTKEIWQAFAFIAFFILLAEWYLYHRRSFSGFLTKA